MEIVLEPGMFRLILHSLLIRSKKIYAEENKAQTHQNSFLDLWSKCLILGSLETDPNIRISRQEV